MPATPGSRAVPCLSICRACSAIFFCTSPAPLTGVACTGAAAGGSCTANCMPGRTLGGTWTWIVRPSGACTCSVVPG